MLAIAGGSALSLRLVPGAMTPVLHLQALLMMRMAAMLLQLGMLVRNWRTAGLSNKQYAVNMHCRRERAELEAGALSDDGSEPVAGAGGEGGGLLSSSDDEEEDEAAFQKNLLEESRRVEEYERLNRISGEPLCLCRLLALSVCIFCLHCLLKLPVCIVFRVKPACILPCAVMHLC
jgi:hypothetical protein